jgi:RNA polymerase sigma factor for flagellar operon FliA
MERFAPTVNRIAHHMASRLPPNVQVDDLIQAGMIGLLEASSRFDPECGANFTTFAEIRIRGAMLDELRRGDWIPRSVHRKAREVAQAIGEVECDKCAPATDREVAEKLGVSINEYHETLTELSGQKLLSVEELLEAGGTVSSADEGSPECLVANDELVGRLADAIGALPEREQLILSLYYDEELNLREIGAVLGVSESRVSQLRSQATLRLRSIVGESSGIGVDRHG